MGISYSASVSYGFLVKQNDIRDKNDDSLGVDEILTDLDIDYTDSANYWGRADNYVVCYVEGTETVLNFDGRDPLYKKLDHEDTISLDSILEIQVKLERAGIPLADPVPGWYLTTAVS